MGSVVKGLTGYLVGGSGGSTVHVGKHDVPHMKVEGASDVKINFNRALATRYFGDDAPRRYFDDGESFPLPHHHLQHGAHKHNHHHHEHDHHKDMSLRRQGQATDTKMKPKFRSDVLEAVSEHLDNMNANENNDGSVQHNSRGHERKTYNAVETWMRWVSGK